MKLKILHSHHEEEVGRSGQGGLLGLLLPEPPCVPTKSVSYFRFPFTPAFIILRHFSLVVPLIPSP